MQTKLFRASARSQQKQTGPVVVSSISLSGTGTRTQATIGDPTSTRGALQAGRRRSSGGARRRPGGSNRPGGNNRNTTNNNDNDGGAPSAPSAPSRRPVVAAEPQNKEVTLPPIMTVRELADLMDCSPIELIKELMNAGVMANINQQLDRDTATIVAEEMGYKVVEPAKAEPTAVAESSDEIAPESEPVLKTMSRRVYTEEEQSLLRDRPPVVTILGHVDHGKTSLLDVIRETNVQAGEAGGITQAIGAYQVNVHGKAITFLDTPGHEAFTAMRARGAAMTDIAILVVAADDGVQPQTREAINHARAAQVPIIVAINKMDLASANPDHVMQQLSELGLVPEEWGGDTICVKVSARMHEGIEDVLDMILLVAEMAEIKAITRGPAQGAVVESRLDRSRGSTATLLVQDGTLKTGDVVLVGNTYGKIRAMFDHQGNPIKVARPSTPVVVMGLRDVPQAGDKFKVLESEREARDIAEQRTMDAQTGNSGPAQMLTLDDISAQVLAGHVQSLNLVLKADVQGSLEPIKNSLEQIEIENIKVRFVHEGVGNVGESDIMLAIASQAIVIGFNVAVDAAAQRLAEAEHVEVRTYSIIYRVIEDVQLALTGMLEPTFIEVIKGKAEVRQVFHIRRVGAIAGSQVLEGQAMRNAKARIKRDGKVLYEGSVSSLKRYTEDVREVNAGYECGIGVDNYDEIEEGDIIEFFTVEQEH